MKEKSIELTKKEKIKDAKEVILSLSLNDFKDEELVLEVSNLKKVMDEFINYFKFPYGTKKMFR